MEAGKDFGGWMGDGFNAGGDWTTDMVGFGGDSDDEDYDENDEDHDDEDDCIDFCLSEPECD